MIAVLNKNYSLDTITAMQHNLEYMFEIKKSKNKFIIEEKCLSTYIFSSASLGPEWVLNDFDKLSNVETKNIIKDEINSQVPK